MTDPAPFRYQSAIFDLGLSRVDHGVRSTDSPELLKIMAEKKILYVTTLIG